MGTAILVLLKVTELIKNKPGPAVLNSLYKLHKVQNYFHHLGK